MLSCIKYVVLFYNFLFWCLGVVILGLSAYLWYDLQSYLDLTEIGQYYVTPFIVLLILGGVMTIVGFLGCCGAVRESSCLLGTYFLFCVTMCVACGTSLFWVIQNEDYVRDNIRRDTHKLIQTSYGIGHTNATEMLIDRIQRKFKCCGASGPQDWVNSSYNNKNASSLEMGIGSTNIYQGFRIPGSCCVKPGIECDPRIVRLTSTEAVAALVEQDIIFKTGCLNKFEDFMKDKWQWVVVTGAILIGIQVFALIFACCLCCAISRVGNK